MNRSKYLYALLFPVLFVLAGCGNYVPVKGKAVFEDDGSPLTVGTVVLRSETHTAKGSIGPDGTFQVGSVKRGDGVPPGVYKVGILGATASDPGVGTGEMLLEDMEKQPPSSSTGPRLLIDPMYANPDTSGIEFDTSKDKTLEIVVRRNPSTKP